MINEEKIQQIKGLITHYFKDPFYSQKLRQKIQLENINYEDLNNEKLIQLLKDCDILDSLLQDLQQIDQIKKFNEQRQNKNPQDKFQTINQINDLDFNSKQRAIGLKIFKGKAFVDYIANFDPNQKFQIFLNFLNFRFKSKAVPVSSDPEFNEQFYFEIQSENTKSSIDMLTLSRLDAQIELVLLLLNEDGSKTVYSQKQIEWRFLLCYGSINLNIEMNSVDAQAKILSNYDTKGKVSVGVLVIQMDLFPKLNLQLLPERILNEQLSKEKKFRDIDTLKFYEYSGQWWNDYKQIHKGFENRAVKLYAEDEDGIYRPVFSFIIPLINIRGIDSPFHAARFVSLIPFYRREKPGGDKIETWHRYHTFLANGRGDIEDHCVLLCSLLLGYGLNAYVVMGSSSDGPHCWCLTINYESKKNKHQYTFWESLTGQRYDSKDPKVNTLYRRVGSVFNDKKFYANIQLNDLSFHVDFDLEDVTKWKPMSSQEIKFVSPFQNQIQFLESNFSVFSSEQILEEKLKHYIKEYRNIQGYYTKFDEKLGYLLTQALSNYEYERIFKRTYGQEEFQTALKSYIQENHTFKAFPIQFSHTNASIIFEKIKQASICYDILNTIGDSVYFAIRSKIIQYPENILAVWISIAVRYYSIE